MWTGSSCRCAGRISMGARDGEGLHNWHRAEASLTGQPGWLGSAGTIPMRSQL